MIQRELKLRKRNYRYWLGGVGDSLAADPNTFKTFLETLKAFQP
jgi:hypothetical protein